MGVMNARAAFTGCQDHTDPDHGPAHAQARHILRRLLPLAADDRQIIGAGWTRFIQLFIAVGTVIADRGRLDKDLGPVAGLPDGRDNLFDGINPAIPDLALDLGVPSLGEKVMTRQADNRVATVNLVLPSVLPRSGPPGSPGTLETPASA